MSSSIGKKENDILPGSSQSLPRDNLQNIEYPQFQIKKKRILNAPRNRAGGDVKNLRSIIVPQSINNSMRTIDIQPLDRNEPLDANLSDHALGLESEGVTPSFPVPKGSMQKLSFPFCRA